jgi:MoaA/NifB/PqqE/SkfB family radical SAM enzyme
MATNPWLAVLSRLFGKPRLAETLSTKQITPKFLAVTAINAVFFLLRSRRSLAPTYIVMEPAGRCNLKCPFCFLTQEGEMRDVTFMPLEFFRDFIARNRRWLSMIHFGMWGEPTLNRDFPAMVRCATDAGIKTVLITNGTRITEPKMHELGRAGLGAINFSADGLGAKYQELRGVPWQKFLDKLAVAARLKRQYGYQIEIGGVEYDLGDRDRFQEFFRDPALGVDRVFTQPLYYAEANKDVKFTRPCYRPWHSLAVRSDGKVTICCYDHRGEHIVGDAATQTLREIFNGPEQEKIRLAFKTGEGIPNLCQGCDPAYR